MTKIRKIKLTHIANLILVFTVAIFFLQCRQVEKNTSKPTRFDSLQIKSEHPRIWIDSEKMEFLKAKCEGKSIEEIQEMAGTSIAGIALTYLITGDEKTGREAIEKALSKYVDPGSNFSDLNTFDGENKRVHIQSSLVEKALCYDWCYPLLTQNEKTEFRNLMVPDMKKRMDFKRVWRSFHNGMYDSAWPLTAATLALDGEEPFTKDAWAYLIPEIEDALKTFDVVFPDGEWGEGMDYNRHSTYPAIRILLAIKSATGADFLTPSSHIKNTGTYIIYGSKPNGLNLPSDDNDWPYTGAWERSALLMLNEVFRDGYNQYFINHCPAERFQFENPDKYNDLLWFDETIQEKSLSELPLSRIFRGKGLVMARSNWNFDLPDKLANSTWLSFRCGDFYGDHVHFDNNSFTISYNGELALDAGRYDCDWGVEDWTISKDSSKIGKSQFFNYYRRTIAHNTILVMDPNEKMPLNLLNDGGQIDMLRLNGVRNVPEDYEQGNYPSEEGIGKCDWATNPGRWETGEITSYKATNDYMYVCGDATKSYSQAKMNSFVRQLVYLQPNIIVVMDRVVSTNPDFKKTWLLHSVNEPIIGKKENSFEITEGNGRLVCVPVLPHQLNVSKIGGPGNEFLVGNTQFQCGLKSVIYPQELHYGEIPGAWCVEINPAVATNEDYFLNVILVSDKQSIETPVVQILAETGTEITIQVNTKDEKSAVLKFTKGEKPTAHIRMMNGEKVLVDNEMPDGVELEEGRFK
jgi:hypothetical protein